MGGDGGSIPVRADMVKTKGYKFLRNLGGMGYTPNTQIKAADEHFGRNENCDIQMSTCAISQEPLRRPTLACKLGRLYNKEEVLSKLLEKSLPSYMQHIKSLKDLREVTTKLDDTTHFFICPITRVDLRSGAKAFVNWKCGCIISKRAILSSRDSISKNRNSKDQDIVEIVSDACLNCGVSYEFDNDLIPLAPTAEEEEVLLRKIHDEKKKRENSKKNKMLKKKEREGEKQDQSQNLSEKKSERDGVNDTIASEVELAAKSLKRQRDWVLSSGDVDELFSSASEKKMRKLESHDGKKSEIYRNLFTSKG